MKYLQLFFTVIALSLIGCGSNPTKKSIAVDTISTKIDILSAEEIGEKNLAIIKEEATFPKTIEGEMFPSEKYKTLNLNAELVFTGKSVPSSSLGDESLIKVVEVDLREELVKIFSPDNATFDCQIPNKLKNLLRAKKGKPAWLPSYIDKFIGMKMDGKGKLLVDSDGKIHKETTSMWPEKVSLIPGFGLAKLLSIAKLKRDNVIKKYLFMNLDFDPSMFLIDDGINNFSYALDCSGYFNAALAVSGTFPGGNIETGAETRMSNAKSIFVAGGVVISPIAAAVYGPESGKALNSEDRIELLTSILDVDGLKDTDSIYFNDSYLAIWGSKEGSTSFNGAGDITGKAEYGFISAKGSVTSNGGGSIKKTQEFKNYVTLYCERQVNNLKPKSIKEIKDILKRLESEKAK